MAVVYIGRVAEIMIFRRSRTASAAPSGINEAPLMMLIPMYTLLFIGFYLGIKGSLTLNLAGRAARELLGGY